MNGKHDKLIGKKNQVAGYGGEERREEGRVRHTDSLNWVEAIVLRGSVGYVIKRMNTYKEKTTQEVSRENITNQGQTWQGLVFSTWFFPEVWGLWRWELGGVPTLAT